MNDRIIERPLIQIVNYDTQNKLVTIAIHASLLNTLLRQFNELVECEPKSTERETAFERSNNIRRRPPVTRESSEKQQVAGGAVRVLASRRKTVFRWLSERLLAPPPTVRRRRKRVRPVNVPRELQQCGNPIRSEKASSPLQPDPSAPGFEEVRSNLDNMFAQLTHHSLAPSVSSVRANAIAASSDGPKPAVEARRLTQIPSSGNSGPHPNEHPTAGNILSKTTVRQGYWGYWSWPKS